MNFIAFDFETASNEKHSACSVALVMVQNSKIVGHYYSLIKPETEFNWRNTQVHGLSESDVNNAPTFPEVWNEISEYFQDTRLLVAHNASFDINVLKACLSYYNLPQVHFLSLCTVRTSRQLWPDFENHRLNTISEKLGINLNNHHHALDDSLACAAILLVQEQLFGVESLKKLVKYI